VIPTRVRKRSAGNPPMMTSVDWSATIVPTRKAATNPRTPMFTGNTVAITNMSASTRMESSSADMATPIARRPEDPSYQRAGAARNQPGRPRLR
jgi:hypothetical protein